MIATIVLAAGASTRLGQPKQLIELGGETLLGRVTRAVHEAGCSPVIVVLGAHHCEILARTNLHRTLCIINHEWQQGMASSIRLGLEAVPVTAEGALLLTCDQPAISASHLRCLMATRDMTASAYAGCHGIPAYFPRSAFARLHKLQGDAGARELLRNARAIDLPGGELDIDTLADLQNAQARFS